MPALPILRDSGTPALPPPPDDVGAGCEAGEATDRPWDEGDFSPLFTPGIGDYFADGGATYRRNAKGDELIAEFVAVPVEERVTIADLDEPHPEVSSVVTMNISTPAGDACDVQVPVVRGKSASAAIIDALPNARARLSVRRRSHVAAAATAFTSPGYIVRTAFAQTGWLPDGAFALPGTRDVDLARLGRTPGLGLLWIPEHANADLLGVGSEVLLQICRSAKTELTLPLLGTIAAAPMFRRADHLAARGFLTLLAGPSGACKTTLLTRMFSLLGFFWRQPGCVATWRTTYATLEHFVHDLRDLPILLDNFRAADGNAQETFRELVVSLGDGTGRGRTTWSSEGPRVVGASRVNALVVATGEHGFDDDAAVNGRMIEVVAQGIDRDALLALTPEDLTTLPHIFSAYLRYLGAQTSSSWTRRRELMHETAGTLMARADARTSEHLATIVTALVTFVEFISLTRVSTSDAWRELAAEFFEALPRVADAQASRVRNDRVDEIVLKEIARGVREGKVRLQPFERREATVGGRLLGAYDETHLLLLPDVVTRWASDEVRASGRRRQAIGRKELGWALAARGGGDGTRVQRTFAGARHYAWSVRRCSLGPDWDGLLEGAPRADGSERRAPADG